MGSRHLSGALILFAATSALSLGHAQTVPRNDARQLRHVMTVRAERTERLLDAWDRAAAPERERVLAFLEAEAGEVPLGRRPSVQALELATRLLERQLASTEPTPLERFAAALDLQAIPGSFPPVESDGASSSSSSLGTPITAGLYALPGAPSLEVRRLDVTLFWERAGEAGPESIRARTEPFDPARFVNPGVPLYLRAPSSGPGLWTLVAELRHGSERVRCGAIPVRCMPSEPSPALFEYGLRAPMPSGRTRLLTHAGGAPMASIETERADVELHVLLLAPAGEAAATPFVGRGGELWEDFADERAARVWSSEIRSGARADFFELLEDVRKTSPNAEVVVIGRGDAASSLHAFLSFEGPRPDRVVLVCALEGVGRALESMPTLLIGPFAENGTPSPQGPNGLQRVRGSRESLFEERLLPEHLDAWLGD